VGIALFSAAGVVTYVSLLLASVYAIRRRRGAELQEPTSAEATNTYV
jgi:hypothetical protein